MIRIRCPASDLPLGFLFRSCEALGFEAEMTQASFKDDLGHKNSIVGSWVAFLTPTGDLTTTVRLMAISRLNP